MRHQLLCFLCFVTLSPFYSISVFASDPLPKPVTICSGANIVIKGDPINILPDTYRWEYYHNGNWNPAPGINNTMDYLATSLLNITTQDIAYTLRRVRTKMPSIELDSYYFVTVQPILPITGNTLDQPLVSRFCGSGNPASFVGSTAGSGNAILFYQWQSSADGVTYTTIDGANDKNYKPGEVILSTYYRRIAMSGGCGASSVSNAILIAIVPPVLQPVADQANLVVCAGSSALLSVKNPVAGITYNWYAAASGGLPIGVGSSWSSPKVTAKTSYYLEAQNKEGCTYAVRQAVEVDAWPVLDAPAVAVEQTTSRSVTFNWKGITGATGYKISTDNGLTYQTPSSGPRGLSHTITGLQSRETVKILVKATAELACQDSGNSTLMTAETGREFDDIFVPNAFTPNKDGKNDVVFVRGQSISKLRFQVYSQWGAQLFYSTAIDNGWDGSFRGISQPVGVYVYTLQATTNDGREINKKGTITLIR